MDYRLGIDVGTNSLGWAAIELRGGMAGPLLDMGVRIFSDARNPKDKSSNAAQRRGPRGARRTRDRALGRKRAMIHALTDYGLFPNKTPDRKALEALDPWVLRARALNEELTPHEIGRALFHLQQRRGFKSNRKTDGAEDGAMFDAIQNARDKMQAKSARTLGELFGLPRLRRLSENEQAANGAGRPLPQARVKARAEGAKMAYDYYPDRDMILDEFEQIWDAQSKHHPEIMTEDAHDAIRHVVEFQRPLKAQPIGKCTFLEGEPRAPKALPSAQYARVLQEVNNLRVGAVGETSRELTDAERALLISFLMRPSNKTARRTFKSIRKTLSLPESQKFSLESRKRDHLVGDLTAAIMMQKDVWGKSWLDLPRADQDEIIARLLDAEQTDDFVPWVMETHTLDEERAMAVFHARLPDAHGKLSKAALDRLIPHMDGHDGTEWLPYDQAATEFDDHRAMGDGVIHEGKLPYYGEVLSRHTAFEKPDPSNDEERFGRVANPTVHVALNELGKIINDLIKRWGPPSQIVLELARDLPLSDRGLRDLESRQKKNQDKNDERRAELAALKVTDTYKNRLKLRLYEEAMESFGGTVVCVFTGEAISRTELFTNAIEVEHILPLSTTLDDSFSNKVLSKLSANRVKKNRTPYVAFGSNPHGFTWDDIAHRASDLPASKAWRFDPDAMAQWEERGGDFLARQLNDTRYIARLGKRYVEALYGGQGSAGEARQVWAVPGRLTSDLRHYAGFNTLTGLTGGNRKDRTDHRHHAVDALVVALTDQAMVKRAADLAKQDNISEHYEIMTLMAKPLKRYRNSAEDRLSKLIVSHKPDHGFQDGMHNDTAFGITDHSAKKGQKILVTRKPVDSLTKTSDIEAIADPVIRERFLAATETLSGKAFSEAVSKAATSIFPNQTVHSVRIHVPMAEKSFVTIRHGEDGRHHKAYKGDGNYCYDIWVNDKGKWTGEVITTFQAYEMAQTDPKWWRNLIGRKEQALVMRLRKGDMLELVVNGVRRVVTVYKFSTGQINMAEHMEADASSRVRAKDLARIQNSPGSLQKANAVHVTVSPSGKVKRHKR